MSSDNAKIQKLLVELNNLTTGVLNEHIKELSNLFSNKVCITMCRCNHYKKFYCGSCQYLYCILCYNMCDNCDVVSTHKGYYCPKCNSKHIINSKIYCSFCACSEIECGETYYCYDCNKFITGYKHGGKYDENIVYSNGALNPEDIVSNQDNKMQTTHNVELDRNTNLNILIKMYPEYEKIFVEHYKYIHG